MRHIIIGTAGHIDHGKTRLTEALTGKNTDRLEEEQKRGITIENGFAGLTLPGGRTAGIIDVPGHERFVRNMIVGATGVDLALMVIAADDGFMPQTQEHLDILQLLGLKKGIIALTKCDLADDEWKEAVEEDIRESVAGTFLENAPIVRVSAVTGEGIEELKAAIEMAAEGAGLKNTELPARLPIDRVFTMQGFGTVVTGTLTEGVIRTGDELMLYPSGTAVRVRELQNHDVSVEESYAGMRTAVNLPGTAKETVQRGSVLAAPGSVFVTDRLDVVLTITDDCNFFIKNASRLHFFHGTSECICKLRLLNAEEVAPGETGYAQLLLEKPLAARNGDRFIVRFFSPVITVGGGVILDVNARRRKRGSEAVNERFAALESDNMEVRALQYMEDRGAKLTDAAELARIMNATAAAAAVTLDNLAAAGKVIDCKAAGGNGFIAGSVLEAYEKKALELLSDYHAKYPLRTGMQSAEFRAQFEELSPESAKSLADIMAGRGVIIYKNGCFSVPGYEPRLSESQQKTAGSMMSFYRKAGCETRTPGAAAGACGVSESDAGQIYEYLCAGGMLITPASGESVSAEGYEKVFAAMKKIAAESGGEVTLAALRDAAGFSRRYAQMYLEYWDRTGITERRGDSHLLRI